MKDYLSNDVIVYKKVGDIEYIQFRKLLEYPEITHCYTLRSNDIISFEPSYKDNEKLISSYQNIGKALNINPNRILKPHQTHTDRVESVRNMCKFDDVDGILTNKKELALLTTSADCTSLLFYDPIKKVIGSVHSGWKGTLKKIAKNTVLKMVKEYDTNPQDVICAIGPTIRKCCFEVEDDVEILFKNKYFYLNLDDIIKKGDIISGKQKYYIDTVFINKQLLIEAGLRKENILDCGICNKCNSNDFHSYRADKDKSGRNGAIIMIK